MTGSRGADQLRSRRFRDDGESWCRSDLLDLPAHLDFLPERFLGIQVKILETIARFAGRLFHGPEAGLELQICTAQRRIGIDVELARQVGDREQNVTEL